MQKQKGLLVPLIIAIVAILVLGGGYYYYKQANTKIIDKAIIDNNQNPVNFDISALIFNYTGQSLSENPQELKDQFILTKLTNGSYVSGIGDPMVGENRLYTYYKSTKGKIDNQDIDAVVLSRLTGNNIIQLILFAFNNDKQVAYADFPPDEGRTTIDSINITDNKIVIKVKTSGPDQNYHITYVPKTYTYQISGNKLILEQASAQNSNQTKDWKTYTNRFYSFNYPNDWSVWEANPLLGLTVMYPSKKSSEFVKKTISLTDEITFSMIDDKYIDKTQTKQTAINGQVWLSKDYDRPFDGGTENGLEYFMQTTDNQWIAISTGQSNRGILLQIISTLKFTK